MKTVTLFICRREADTDLEAVVSGVFDALSISDWEERESSNYPPDEHYFVGYCANAEITIYDGDDDRTPDYPLRVSVAEAHSRKGSCTIPVDSAALAVTLVAGGFTVFAPAGPWESSAWDGHGHLYGA